jgi:adhesin transport system outer membrane protein
MAAFALAGCMTRPPVGAGLSCPVTVPQCHGPVYSVGGFNDDATLTTGSIGNAATAAVAPDAIVDASEEPMGLAVQTMPDRAGPTDESVAELALGPALRLTPLTASDASELPAATGDPSQLNQAPESPSAASPMANADELELRASDSPLTLDPPVQDASIAAPQLAGNGEVDEGSVELAGTDGFDSNVPLPPARQFDGDISVTADRGEGPHMTLADVVTRAATMHPEITLALARVDEARAGVQRARSGLGPQVDLTLAAGQTASATYDPTDFDLNNRSADAAARLDGTVRLRQLLFDFNVTRDQVLSTLATSDAARLRTIDVTEDLALRTAQAYLRIFQQRQLLALIDRNIVEHERLLEIVELNEADGNSTMADVNRVSARLSEVRSARTDLAADLDAAEDAFERLARIAPGRLQTPAPVISNLAPSADDAIDRALSSNPRLLSLAYTVRAAQHELDVVNGDGRARIDLELEASSNTYISANTRTENDARGMVVFSYSLFDAGNAEGEQREVEARIRQARARYTDTRDQVEADIRQAYRAIASARRKLGDLRSGLQSSRQVQALYTEQFQAGERTIFELLDAQNALFSAEQELILSQFSELEAAYSVLRSTGRLTSTILNQAG